MRYSLHLLGGASLEGPAGPLSGHPAQRRQLALLALLATARDGGISRDKLLACLWPESSEQTARHSLADSVYRLRKAFGEDAILGTGVSLRINPEIIGSDVACFEASMRTGDYEAACDLYRGPFLDGFHFPDSAEFEHWHDAESRRLSLLYKSALTELATCAEKANDSPRAASLWRRLLAQDPFNSRTAVRLMESLAAAGDPANALKVADEHAELLRTELGVEPQPDLAALALRLRSLRTPPSRPAGVTGSHATTSDFPFGEPGDRRPPQAAAPFVGREEELGRFRGFLRGALAGEGCVAFITGEAGTGKTMLAAEFCRRASEAEPGLIVAGGNGNAHTGPGDPYLPFREVLGLLTGDVEPRFLAGSLTRAQAARLWTTSPLVLRALAQSAPDLVGTFVSSVELGRRIEHGDVDEETRATLLRSLRAAAGPAPFAAPAQAAFCAQYVRLLRRTAQEHPLLLVLDDLQWADEGSIGLLFQLGRQLPGCRALVLGLYRPSDLAVGRNGNRNPLAAVVNELKKTYGDVEVQLEESGDRGFIDDLIDAEPNTLDAAFRETLFRRTGGHALFTVELFRSMREAGKLIADREGRLGASPGLDWSRLPARVEALLAERIGRLPEDLRRVLSIASVEGETFTVEAVAAVAGISTVDLLSLLAGELEKRHRLVLAHGIRRAGSTRISEFRFRHILFQRFLYDGLDGVERVHLHGRLALALEGLHADAKDDEAVTLAHHFRAAGLDPKTVEYLMLAGERARRSGAYSTGFAHLREGLELLGRLPRSADHARLELDLNLVFGMAHLGSGDFTAEDARSAFLRASELASRMGDERSGFWARSGLFHVAHNRGDRSLARSLAEECLGLADQLGDIGAAFWAHDAIARHFAAYGEFRRARGIYETLLDALASEPREALPLIRGIEPEALALATGALPLWLLGESDRAVEWGSRGTALAAQATDLGTLGTALIYEALVRVWRREPGDGIRVIARLREVVAGRPGYAAFADIFEGWCAARLGEPDRGIDLCRQGLEAYGSKLWRPCYLGFLADILLRASRLDEAASVLHEARELEGRTDDRAHSAETRRLLGELRVARGEFAEAETAFREAIDIARGQEAKAYELRATTALTRLLRAQGRYDEARPLLAAVVGAFTEGFTTEDLQEARALLDLVA
jgi:DNA-binding SARP family transcriptional activator